MRGEDVRTALKLRSTRFTVANAPGGNFLLQGRGFGHGVGLSQWGAYNLALQRANHLQILAYYFRGVALSPIRAR